MITRGIRELVARDWARSKGFASQKISGVRCSSAIPAGRMPRHAQSISPSTSHSPNGTVVPVQPAAVELLAALAPVAGRWGRGTSSVRSGIRIPIIELSDLIIAKILAGRPKDVDDARAFWQLHRPEVEERRSGTVHR